MTQRRFAIALFIGILTFCTFYSASDSSANTYFAPTDGIAIGNDSGVVGDAYDDLIGRRSLAIRFEMPAEVNGLRMDGILIYLAPQEGMNAAKFFLRLEPEEDGAPASGNPSQTWRITIPLDEPRWYFLPLNYQLKQNELHSIIISLRSEDFPWNPAPLIMLDDSTNIPAGYNFYGENFSNWLEHYQYWQYPEKVGNIMLRVHLTPKVEATVTPVVTIAPQIWLPILSNSR